MRKLSRLALLVLSLTSITAPSLLYAAQGQNNTSAPVNAKANSTRQLVSFFTLLQERATQLEAMLNQNKGGFVQNNPKAAHYLLNHHLILSARANGDAGINTRLPSRDLDSQGRYSDNGSAAASLTNAFVYADMMFTSWATAHVTGMYGNFSGFYQRYDQDNGLTAERTASGLLEPSYHRNNFSLDEAYVRLEDFSKSPLFLEGGRFYQPFGHYEVHPLSQSLTQELSQTWGDGVSFGAISPLGGQLGNLEANLFIFKPAWDWSQLPHQDRSNYGAQLSYRQESDAGSFTVDVGYLHDMNEVNYIVTTTPLNPNLGIEHHVGAIAFDALSQMGPFDTHFDFVTGLSRFDLNEVAYRQAGATPKAIDVGGGYRFDLLGHDSHFGLSYQHSWQAAFLGLGSVIPGAGLPEHRAQADYSINLLQYLNLHFLTRYDKDYSTGVGGTGKSGVTGLVRLSVAVA